MIRPPPRSTRHDTSVPFAPFCRFAVAALVKMARVSPNELRSLMLDVGGKVIADAEPDETDLEDLARAAVDVLQKYVAARHPESPGGVRIVHSETDDIKMSARALGDRAGKVTA